MKNKCWFCTKRKMGLVLASLFYFGHSFAVTIHNTPEGPWLTGPLIAYAGVTLPAGSYDAEPYFSYTKTYTPQRNYSINPLLSFSVGLAKRLDVQVVPSYAFNQSQDREHHGFEDFTMIWGAQLYKSPQNYWPPNVKLLIEQVFPVGKFEHLDPAKLTTDSLGEGSYQTGLGLSIEQIYTLPHANFLNLVLNVIYSFPSSVNVNGFNAYGGGFNTKGVVNPGNALFVDLAFELTLTRHVALAMDTVYMRQAKTTFRGNLGTTPDNLVAQVGGDRNDSLSLSPAVEYNFTGNLGIIAGMTFSVYAHNTENVVSGLVAVNYAS